MIDFGAIADADPGGSLQAAYDDLSTRSSTVYKALSGNDLRKWAVMFSADYDSIKASASANTKAEIALLLIQTPDSTLSMGETGVQDMVNALASEGVITTPARDALYAMAAYQTFDFPGLRPSDVRRAREKRQAGEV